MTEKKDGEYTLVIMLIVGMCLGAGIGYVLAPSETFVFGWNNITVKIREDQIMNLAEQYHYVYNDYTIKFFYYPSSGTLYSDIIQGVSVFDGMKK